MSNAQVNDNTAASTGGGIRATSIVTINGASQVNDNTSTTAGGGGIYAYSIDVSGASQVNGNTAGGNGGGMWGNYINLYNGAQLNDNKALNGNGGGMYVNQTQKGYYAYVGLGAQVMNNQALNGGGIYSDGSDLFITSDSSAPTIISGNMASQKGGAVFVASQQYLPTDALREVTLFTSGIPLVFDGNYQDVTNFSAPSSGTPNSFYFGRSDGGPAQLDMALDIVGGGDLDLSDPIEVSLDNGKAFSMANDSTGLFKWGGTNVLDAAGGSTISLNDGTTSLYDGFRLSRGAINATSNIVLDLSSGATLETPGLSTFDGVNLNLDNGSRLSLSAPDSRIDLIGSTLSMQTNATMRVDLKNRIGTTPMLSPDGGSTLAIANSPILIPAWFPSTPTQTRARYLVVDDLSRQTGDFVLGPSPSSKLALTLIKEGNELWLDTLYDFDDGGDITPSGNPNGQRAYPGLVDWGNRSDSSSLELLQLADQADYLTAEMMSDQALVAMNLHRKIADQATSLAFPGALNGLSGTDFDTLHFSQGMLEGTNENQTIRLPAIAWRPATSSSRTRIMGNARTAETQKENHAGLRFFSGYLGHFGAYDEKDRYYGYDTTHNGFMLGGVSRIASDWDIGAYVAYASGRLTMNGLEGQRLDSTTTQTGLFTRYADESGLRATADISYSFSNNDSTRRIVTDENNYRPTAGYNQNILSSGLELAYDGSPDPVSRLTPFLQTRYLHLEQDGFQETSALGLIADPENSTSLTTRLGASYARDFFSGDSFAFTPKLTLAWLHEYGDDTFSTTTAFTGSPVRFEAISREQERDALQLGLALEAIMQEDGMLPTFAFNLGYGAEWRKTSMEHTVFAGIRFFF